MIFNWSKKSMKDKTKNQNGRKKDPLIFMIEFVQFILLDSFIKSAKKIN